MLLESVLQTIHITILSNMFKLNWYIKRKRKDVRLPLESNSPYSCQSTSMQFISSHHSTSFDNRQGMLVCVIEVINNQ